MDSEEKNQRGCQSIEADFFLQWGNKKRLRGMRVKDPSISQRSTSTTSLIRRKMLPCIFDRFNTTTANTEKSASLQQSNRLTRNSQVIRPGLKENNRKSSSPEKEDRYYTTRGSVGVDENCKVSFEGNHIGEEKGGFVWPKLYISLSTKEKEEDFMAMKGCKPPQRPKKRAKIIQRSLLMVSPGAWLTDMCQERYEVREKKSSKKRPRGLKAMGSMESDSE